MCVMFHRDSKNYMNQELGELNFFGGDYNVLFECLFLQVEGSIYTQLRHMKDSLTEVVTK